MYLWLLIMLIEWAKIRSIAFRRTRQDNSDLKESISRLRDDLLMPLRENDLKFLLIHILTFDMICCRKSWLCVQVKS